MNEEQLLQDRAKIAEFLSLAESGSIQAGLSPEQRQQINDYVIQQRNVYADASYRAQDPNLAKTSPDYIANIQTMNQVKQNLINLSNQQNAITTNQQQYLDDYQANRLSKANYMGDNPSGLVDVYTHRSPMSIDAGGNIMFDVNGKPQLYKNIADYSLKASDTANGILDIVDKVYNSKSKLSNGQIMQINNRLRTLVEGGGRSTLLSLVKDNLLPGFDEMQLPDELFKKENHQQLENFFLKTMNNAILEVNGQLPEELSKMSDIEKREYDRETSVMLQEMRNNAKPSRTSPQTTTATGQPDFYQITGKTDEERGSYVNIIDKLEPGQEISITSMSLPSDPNARRTGGNYYGVFDYVVTKAANGGIVATAYDKQKNIVGSTNFKNISEFSKAIGVEYKGSSAGDILTGGRFSKYNKSLFNEKGPLSTK